MLKHTVTYTNFLGNEATRDVYFNLTTTELLLLQANYADRGGLLEHMEAAQNRNDTSALMVVWHDMLLTAYGEISADGETFVKNPVSRQSFASSAAFDKIFLDCLTNPENGMKFVQAIFPQDLVRAAQAELDAQKANVAPTLPPPPPNSVS